MISSAETFLYFAIVPTRPDDTPARWRLRSAEHIDAVPIAMPFGREPTLVISDQAPPTNAGPERPWVLRSRFTLSGSDWTAYFHVDRSLTSELCAGDVIHVARSERGGLGLSVLRNDRLVVAVGAVTAVPLGEDVSVRIAPERYDEALTLVEPPDGTRNWNPSQRYRDEWPVEIPIDGTTHLFFRRNETNPQRHPTLHRARVLRRERRVHRAVANRPDPAVGANASAFLLATDGLEVS